MDTDTKRKEPSMRKTIAALGVGAALAVGGATVLSADTAAFAQDDTTIESDSTARHDTVLAELVDAGVITQEQADAISEALAEAAPRHRGPGFHRGGESLELAADAIGIEVEELRAALGDGSSIADVATENGVSVDAVVDALVAGANERIDQAVEDERISAEDAEARRAEAEERIQALVNGELPADGDRHGRRGFGRGGFNFGSGGPAGPDANAEANV